MIQVTVYCRSSKLSDMQELRSALEGLVEVQSTLVNERDTAHGRVKCVVIGESGEVFRRRLIDSGILDSGKIAKHVCWREGE